MTIQVESHSATRQKLRLGAPYAVLVSLAAIVTAAALLVGAAPQSARAATSAPTGLHVSGNRLLDSTGKTVVLRGVDRSGTEYQCVHGYGIFDGPSDAASIAAMAAWHITAVRVPLNEDCWLGINGVAPAYAGSNYQAAIAGYVSRLHAAGLVAILDLHWNAPGSTQAGPDQKMADADHATAFWSSVASAYKSDGSAVFDLFNEPHDVSWTCWRDGGNCGTGYQVAGMQSLVNAVRSTGATNPVLVGGLAFANDLSSWSSYRPSDPTGNLMASWHAYNFNACNTDACWNAQIAPVAASVPLVTGEIGENDCAHGYLDHLLPWLDNHAAGYLGWGWDPFDCGSFPALITNYDGTPSNFGIGLRDHLASVAATTPTPTPSTTQATSPTSTPTPTGSSPTASSAAIAVNPSSITANAPYYWEDDLSLQPTDSVTGLSVTISVPKTTGLSYAGLYTTAPDGAVATSSSTSDTSITYTATLNAGRSLPNSYQLKIGAQYNGTGNSHATSTDTYRVTATVGGKSFTAAGHF